MSKKLSGSEYRKRAAKKRNDELETLQKVPKIGSFFKSVDLTDSKTSESTSLKLDLQEGIQIQEECTSTTITTDQNKSHGEHETTVSQPSEVTSDIEVGLPSPQAFSIAIDDPGTWDVTLNEVVENVPKNCQTQNLTANFSRSERLYNESKRTLSVNIFQSTLPNGDTVLRDWLLYSQTTGKVFCVPCCLFQPITMKTNFSTGFNDWKHSNELLKQHEQSQDHRKNVLTYITRKKSLLQVDTLLFTQYEGEIS